MSNPKFFMSWPGEFDPQDPLHCTKEIGMSFSFQGMRIYLEDKFEMQVVWYASWWNSCEGWYVYNLQEYKEWLKSNKSKVRDVMQTVLQMPGVSGKFDVRYKDSVADTNSYGYTSSGKYLVSYYQEPPIDYGEIEYRVYFQDKNEWSSNLALGDKLMHVTIDSPNGSRLDWNMPRDLFKAMLSKAEVFYGLLTEDSDVHEETPDLKDVLSSSPSRDVLAYRFPFEDNAGRTELYPTLRHAVLVNASLYDEDVTPIVYGWSMQSQEMEGALRGSGFRFFHISGEVRGWTTVVIQGNIFLP